MVNLVIRAHSALGIFSQLPDTVPPSVPGSLSPSVISFSQIDLSWAISIDPTVANELSSGVEDYLIYRSTDGINFSLRAAIPHPTAAYSDTGLAHNTTHYYRISARDVSQNESAQSSIVSATTPINPALDVTPPSAPTSLVATAVSSSQINLSWNNGTDTESGIQDTRVERATASGGPYSEIGFVVFPDVTFQDTGRSPSTTYFYRARHRDNATPTPNASVYSSVASATTQASQGGSLTAQNVDTIGDDVVSTATTLAGENFGGSGPTTLYYDDFRNQSNGAAMSTTPILGSPSILSSGDGMPIIDTSQSVSKGRSIRIKDVGSSDNYRARINWGASNGAQATILMSVWVRSEKAEGSYNTGGWKMTWDLVDQGSDASGDGEYDACVPTFSNGWRIGGNSTTVHNSSMGNWLTANTWRRVLWWRTGSSTWYFQRTGSGYGFNVVSGSSIASGTSFQASRQFNFPGYLRSGSDYRAWFDMPYLANSAARVEIGNASTYTTCNTLYIQTVVSWANNTVVFTGRHPNLTANNWWLYFIDSNNQPTNGGVGRLITST